MKHAPLLEGSECSRVDWRRAPFIAHFRYWSRSHAIQVAREAGDLIQLGGEDFIRTCQRHAVSERFRMIGYKNLVILDDDDPILLGSPKNEPDYEAIYNIMLGSPEYYNNKKRFDRLLREYRTGGTDD